MEPDAIESAYVPFVVMLREGGFSEPEQGWPAELVAAHVASNNDLIAGVAEQIAAGEAPTYDNSEAVDDETLRNLAAEVGGLADWPMPSRPPPAGWQPLGPLSTRPTRATRSPPASSTAAGSSTTARSRSGGSSRATPRSTSTCTSSS